MPLIKAREIREKLQGKIDPVIIDVLCKMTEEHKQHNDHVHALAEAYDRLTNMFTDVIRATNNIGKSQSDILMRLGITNASDTVKSLESQDDDTKPTQ